MKHFVLQDSHGQWHTCYRVPGTDIPSSVMVALTQTCAEREARRLNELPAWVPALPAAERPLVPGFYTDEDAK